MQQIFGNQKQRQEYSPVQQNIKIKTREEILAGIRQALAIEDSNDSLSL